MLCCGKIDPTIAICRRMWYISLNGKVIFMDTKEIILYETPDHEVRLDVTTDRDTVWLNRAQLAELFDRDIKTIGKHINNALKEELSNDPATVAIFATVQIEGEREVTRDIEFYNLDVIISVGYRVKSQRGVEFRRWANEVLKDYIIKGYAVNNKRIEQIGEVIRIMKRAENQLDAKQELSVIEKFNTALDLLDAYDHQTMKKPKGSKAVYVLDYDEWIEHRAPSLQATTVDGYRSMCHGPLQKYFEPLGMTVYDPTGEDLNGFYSHLAKLGLKGSSIQRFHGLIHGAYTFLVKHQYIDSNPCGFADRPKAEHYRGDFYSPAELGELFRAAENSPIRIPIMLASYYGLRRSEVLGVRWSNIDLKNKIIKIAHKVVEQKIGGKITVVGYDRMKTESSNRVLPLIPEVEDALLRL